MQAWKYMALCRVRVRKGKTHGALLAALLLASACSSDSSVSFDPNPDLSATGGSGGSGGTASAAGKGNGASGSESRAGGAATAGTGSQEGGAGNRSEER